MRIVTTSRLIRVGDARKLTRGQLPQGDFELDGTRIKPAD